MYKDSAVAGPARLQAAVTQVKAGSTAAARDRARELLAAVARDFPALANSAAYWTARCDLLDANYAAAKKSLERLAATRTPEIAEIQFDLAYCELMLGHDAAALQQLEAFRKTYPYSSHRFEALYYEATALHRQGDYQKSIEFCDAAGDAPSPVVRQAQLLKGENLLMLTQYDK